MKHWKGFKFLSASLGGLVENKYVYFVLQFRDAAINESSTGIICLDSCSRIVSFIGNFFYAY